MLQEIFYWVFNMSITASVTGAIILLIRLIKRIPRRIMVFFWTIPFLRMIIPLGLNSPYNLMSLISKITTKTIVVYQPAENVSFSMMNSVMAADTYFPITYKVNVVENIFNVASIMWITVSLVILIMLIIMYSTTLQEIKEATQIKDNIYFSNKVVTPAVYGILKPKIILPATYKNKDNELVILHENTHIRSKDNLWRMIAFAVVAIHWFNPLCWLFLKLFLTDLELSCDERVLIKISNSRSKEYALSLLESKKNTTVFTSALGGAKIQTRIKNILSFKRLTWLSLTAFIFLIGIIFYTLMTNAG